MRYIGLGAVLMLLGAVLAPMPWVPGMPLIGVGAVFVCSASFTAARAMDFAELRIRGLARRLSRRFRREDQ